MAASLFNALADPRKARARSAGTAPGEHVHAEVVTAMREVGIDLSTARPLLLTPELAEGATWLVTMGCGESCPVVPGTLREDWPIADPAGQSLVHVRQIRDEIQQRVTQFVTDRDLR
jgi:arsenate reductase (thioredoxin)